MLSKYKELWTLGKNSADTGRQRNMHPYRVFRFFFLFQKILESSIDMESPVPQTHLALPCGSFHRQDHI